MTLATLAAPSPVAVFESALSTGAAVTLTPTDPVGSRTVRPVDWCRDTLPGDETLLDRCAGPTLDVGCGPGRLTRALAERGQHALGVDISAGAVRLARRRGARALRRDVFGPLPAEGRWARVLLADGNIGIDGDPVRLLRRCRELSTPDGRILVEVDPPGAPAWAGEVRIAADGGAPSAPFRWAYVGADHLAGLARAAGVRVLDQWTEAGRWFADLS
ncbi:methyltransferase type 12 [Virgisporangium ochraceum]|uniref:Methyltransferase type 12 n=1 Tax=Virgisporangium ochraceum TaxID=65505 RepID=A0A8J4EIA9_9ACTN|nr:class I SAM-dependent methyltransferase [Virgisporangium ochraceum]GIJ73077.1 methyltransferase type 12 [Virgisporangium ochraceum]